VCSRESIKCSHDYSFKGKTDKCNHGQHLKHENKVPIKYDGDQDTYFSCNKEN
jgi:hypothetical protein